MKTTYTRWKDTEGREIHEGEFVTKGELVGEVCWDEDRQEWVVAYNPPEFCTSLDDGWRLVEEKDVEAMRDKFRSESNFKLDEYESAHNWDLHFSDDEG